MSSYVREYDHPEYKVINHHRYKYVRSYVAKRDAVFDAARWNGEPGVSAKVIEEGTSWTLWVSEKRRWARR